MNYSYSVGNGPLGALIAIIVLVAALVLGIDHRIDEYVAGLIAALAIARLT